MHSTLLRGADFRIKSHQLEISHKRFCQNFTRSTKLGVYTPNGIEAIGATNLILMFVTAFYDRLRSLGKDFHLYPEFYTFQCNEKLTDYGMFDIYPIEKNRFIESDPSSLIDALNDTEIDILLLPEESFVEIKKVMKSDMICFLYSESGEVQNPNLIIETERPEITEWIDTVVGTSHRDYTPQIKDGLKLVQSFQEVV